MSRRNYFLILVISAAAFLANGCASYRHRVADDFRDAVKLNVGVGLGFYADAKVTSFLNPGLGWGGYWQNIGLESRYTDFVHPSLNGCPFPWGVIPGFLPGESPVSALRMANVRGTCRTNMDDDYIVAGQLFDGNALTQWHAYGIQKENRHDILHNGEPTHTEGPMGLEAGAGILFFHVRAGFDPVEFADLLCAVCGFDLLHDKKSEKASATAKARTRTFTYAVKITNGQVFLSLNAKPDQIIGPFIKKSDDTYTCETHGEGLHSLTRSPNGDWFYSWSHLQMRPETVDGRWLGK